MLINGLYSFDLHRNKHAFKRKKFLKMYAASAEDAVSLILVPHLHIIWVQQTPPHPYIHIIYILMKKKRL